MPHGGSLLVSLEEIALKQEWPWPAGIVRPGRFAELQVRDTGSGIPDEVLPRLFEPFATTKEEGRGSGLGLATVLSLVDEMGGAWKKRQPEG